MYMNIYIYIHIYVHTMYIFIYVYIYCIYIYLHRYIAYIFIQYVPTCSFFSGTCHDDLLSSCFFAKISRMGQFFGPPCLFTVSYARRLVPIMHTIQDLISQVDGGMIFLEQLHIFDHPRMVSLVLPPACHLSDQR